MARVAQSVERQIVVLEVAGSIPVSRPTIFIVGVSPSGKALDFDSSIRRFKSCHPSQKYGPLAQAVEHLTFNQVVRGSSPRWFTTFYGVYDSVKLYALLAQLVEQLTLNQWVLGSSPRWRTNKYLTIRLGVFLLPSGTRTAFAH